VNPCCLFALTQPDRGGPGDWIHNISVCDVMPLHLRHGALHHGSALRISCLGAAVFAVDGCSVGKLLNDGGLLDGGVRVAAEGLFARLLRQS
jgi:hypothetical protein